MPARGTSVRPHRVHLKTCECECEVCVRLAMLRLPPNQQTNQPHTHLVLASGIMGSDITTAWGGAAARVGAGDGASLTGGSVLCGTCYRASPVTVAVVVWALDGKPAHHAFHGNVAGNAVASRCEFK